MNPITPVLLVILGSACAVAENPVVKIRPAAAGLVWMPEKDDTFVNSELMLQVYPTSVAVHLAAVGKRIAYIDVDNSEFTTFTDDRGRKLEGHIAAYPHLAADRSEALIELCSEQPVPSGAHALIAKGKLQMGMASRTRTQESKVVPLRKGSRLEVEDDLVFQVAQTGPSPVDETGLGLTLTTNRDSREVAAFRFFDQDGKLIESLQYHTERKKLRHSLKVDREFHLDRKATNIRIEVDFWTDLDVITVPFDLRIVLGGAEQKNRP